MHKKIKNIKRILGAGGFFALLILGVFFVLFFILHLFATSDLFYIFSFAFGLALIFLLLCSFGKGGALFEKEICEADVIAETLEDGLISYDADFKILSFNTSAQKIFGLKEQDVIGKKITPGLSGDEKYKKLAAVLFPSLAPLVIQTSEAGVWPQITEVSVDDLGLRTVSNKVPGKNGKVSYFIKIIEDKTRERNILKNKSEFINTAAHQLRTPLTSINWALEYLRRDETISQKEDLQKVLDEAVLVSGRALKITNDLLDVAKIEDGKFGYNMEKINLSEFIKGVLGAARPYAKERGVNILFVPEKESDFWVRADIEKLGIALSNLVENAIKYNSENGEVVVLVKEIPGNLVEVGIKDSGVGIPDREKKFIFTKFFRGSNIKKNEPDGSGLGLFITRNIIAMHGGGVRFESETGRGTTFFFTLPLNGSEPSL